MPPHRARPQVHISMAFVTVQMLCSYPPEWREAPLAFFLPKTSDTAITCLSITNLVRPSVYGTAVVAADEARRFGSGTAGGMADDGECWRPL